MPPIKKNVDLGFLNGRELIQLCIGLYQIIFKFDDELAISVEQGFCYFDGQDKWTWRPEPGSSLLAARAVTLLGTRIDSFEVSSGSTLVLNFSNGHNLTIMGGSNGYESYDITRPGQSIVV
jgi:hypothetical protein